MKYFYLEFIPVVPVFPEGPHGHLVGSGEGEDPRRKTLRHQAETEPGTNLKVKLEVITAVPVQCQWWPVAESLPRTYSWDRRRG